MRVFEFFDVETAYQEYVIITARCHPGETLQSYVLSTLMDRIIQAGFHPNVSFLIIPIINVDGVYRGNYRADCYG